VINNQALAYYMYLTQEFLMTAGVDPKKFRFRKHGDDELAHYATECWDAELFSERFGWIECVGIADRSAYDLNAHIQSSGTDMYALRKFDEPKITKVKKIVPNMGVMGPLFKGNAGKIKTLLENMEVKDTENISVNIDGENIEIPKKCYEIVQKDEKVTGEKFVPHVIEPSFGIDRILYCILEHNYSEGEKKGEEYRVLKFNSIIAPIKVGVLPLISDKKLVKIANEIDINLRNAGIKTYYDDGGSIGRRYARMDEVGTPFCITVDHDTLEDNTVTVRDRDTTKQVRKKIDEITEYIKDKVC
jgi:glycyl-tRNA synthetase